MNIKIKKNIKILKDFLILNFGVEVLHTGKNGHHTWSTWNLKNTHDINYKKIIKMFSLLMNDSL